MDWRARHGVEHDAIVQLWPACPTCGARLQPGQLDTGIPGTSHHFPVLECPNMHTVDPG